MSIPEPRSLVLVDDDPHFLAALAANLAVGGYRIETFQDPRLALARLTKAPAPSICVFDWNMPGLDGLALFNAVRAAGRTMPVLFLTSLREPMYEELALAQGAVDFIEKSRSPAIILKRLEMALLPHAPQRLPPTGIEIIGDLQLKTGINRAIWRGAEVRLSLGEFNMLRRLARHPGEDVSYRELYDEMHGTGFVAGAGDEGYRDNVRAMIKRIRGKFLAIDPNFEQLENYAGFGYRWRPSG